MIWEGSVLRWSHSDICIMRKDDTEVVSVSLLFIKQYHSLTSIFCAIRHAPISQLLTVKSEWPKCQAIWGDVFSHTCTEQMFALKSNMFYCINLLWISRIVQWLLVNNRALRMLLRYIRVIFRLLLQFLMYNRSHSKFSSIMQLLHMQLSQVSSL